MNKLTKKDIIEQLHKESGTVAGGFDKKYSSQIEAIAEGLADLFNKITDIINSEEQTPLSDSDHRGALLFFTSLNTVMAALELFKRGYPLECAMLLRNNIETFSAAYDIHANPPKVIILEKDPKKFDSTESIKEAKKVSPLIGQMYGKFSDTYTHVSAMHLLPHHLSKTPFAIGGLFDPIEEKYHLMILSMILLELDILGSLLEFSFLDSLNNLNYWTKDPTGAPQPQFSKKVILRGQNMGAGLAKHLGIQGT